MDNRPIRERREQAGLSKDEVAKHLNMTPRTYAKREARNFFYADEWVRLDHWFRTIEEDRETQALQIGRILVSLMKKAQMDPAEERLRADLVETVRQIATRLPDDGSEETGRELAFLYALLWFADHSAMQKQAQTI